VLALKEAKHYCDFLIVGLHVDPSMERGEKNKPIQSMYERYVQLESCEYVDEIIPYETEGDLLVLLQTQDIDVRFLGDDYGYMNEVENNQIHDPKFKAIKKFTGDTLPIKIQVLKRYGSFFSSSGLRKAISEIEQTKK
jgi:glycerol-3-phosphate cytidylyltransferase